MSELKLSSLSTKPIGPGRDWPNCFIGDWRPEKVKTLVTMLSSLSNLTFFLFFIIIIIFNIKKKKLMCVVNASARLNSAMHGVESLK